MDWLRAHWVLVAVVTAVSGLAIQLAEPDYTSLQTASDAAEFVRLIDSAGRAISATLADVVFALAYGTLGVIGLRAHGRGSRLATAATVLVVVGAASDEVENSLVLANILRRRSLTDGWVDAMQVPGTTKWVAVAGLLVLIGFLVRSALERPRQGTNR